MNRALSFFMPWILIFEPRYRATFTPALELPLCVETLTLPIGFTTCEPVVNLTTGEVEVQ